MLTLPLCFDALLQIFCFHDETLATLTCNKQMIFKTLQAQSCKECGNTVDIDCGDQKKGGKKETFAYVQKMCIARFSFASVLRSFFHKHTLYSLRHCNVNSHYHHTDAHRHHKQGKQSQCSQCRGG